MRRNTRNKYNAYLTQLAKINNVDVTELSSTFEVEPSVEQRLEEVIQQSAAFLKLINIESVSQQEGEVIGLDISESIASTTDTDFKDREPIDPLSLRKNRYRCEETHYDTSLRYSQLDRWAKFNDFQLRVRNIILKRQALDRIKIGFNGVIRSANSDKKKNKLLQDVNIGWLQKVRELAPDRVMSKIINPDGSEQSTIKIGNGQSYNNLDALVMDAIDNLISEEYRDDDQMVAICGRKLLSDKYFPLVNKDQDNSELLSAEQIISQKQIGGLIAIRAPYFPDSSLMITRLDNLSIYWQEGTRRRSIINNPRRSRIETFESVNESFVIENYDCVALIENIEVIGAVQAINSERSSAPANAENEGE